MADEQAVKNPTPNPNSLGLIYRRGLAGLRAGHGAEASAEFRKILDHKGQNWGPQYSLANLGLARAQALLIAARKEYAALK
jgi:hypothetical protein